MPKIHIPSPTPWRLSAAGFLFCQCGKIFLMKAFLRITALFT
nr:MAG TPA: hypothetical protein [Caudoviricetes sp.]